MSAKPHLGREQAITLLRKMRMIRRFEEASAEQYTLQKIRGFLHLYIGEEANAVGVMQALSPADAVVATYREHGHALARGVPATAVMAEMFGKVTGCSRGRGGSMHLFDAGHRFYGGNAIVGGGLPLAVGLALADRMQRREVVTCCFFGEGAVAEGAFHESLNLASMWRLPVLFVCENNGYAMGTEAAHELAVVDVARHATSFGIEAETVDGMDVVAVHAAASRLVAAVRGGSGPRLLESRTYRFCAHSMFDAELYRDKAEVARWREKDPIQRFQSWAITNSLIHPQDLEAMQAAIEREVAEAVAFADASPLEPVADLLHEVCADERMGVRT